MQGHSNEEKVVQQSVSQGKSSSCSCSCCKKGSSLPVPPASQSAETDANGASESCKECKACDSSKTHDSGNFHGQRESWFATLDAVHSIASFAMLDSDITEDSHFSCNAIKFDATRGVLEATDGTLCIIASVDPESLSLQSRSQQPTTCCFSASALAGVFDEQQRSKAKGERRGGVQLVRNAAGPFDCVHLNLTNSAHSVRYTASDSQSVWKPFPNLWSLPALQPDWKPDVAFSLSPERLKKIVEYAEQNGCYSIVFGMRTDRYDGQPRFCNEGLRFTFDTVDTVGIVMPMGNDTDLCERSMVQLLCDLVKKKGKVKKDKVKKGTTEHKAEKTSSE